MSMAAMLGQEEKAAPADSASAAPAALPSDEALLAHWPALAALYSSKPRLYSMLSTSKLSVSEAEGKKTITFQVVNQAQKEWVETKLLHELEANFRRLCGVEAVLLSVEVIPMEETGPAAYMPSDKAKVLMSENDNVKNLVKDLNLDIK